MKKYQIGHRERLRQRYLEKGFVGFSDREKLEYFLCLCIPRKDVKPLADKLLKKYKTISKVIDQTIDELESVEGIGKSTAINIAALRDFFGVYFSDLSKNKAESITKMSSLVEILRASIGHKPNEVLFAIFLNAKNEVLCSKELGEGTVSQASAFPRAIVEEALKQKATSIILAHNHPGGVAEPSEQDESITTEIQKALALVAITLQDHIILANNEYYSFKRNNLL
ncbi:MAG TPA: DNA repair protein RadC [Ignavibacteriaceae bacterium]|nr:DNA repair protein RadC [Ignavibacteriaceae bacterium]